MVLLDNQFITQENKNSKILESRKNQTIVKSKKFNEMFITKTMTPDASKTLSQRRPSHQHKSHSKNLLNLFKKEFHDKKINGKEYKISKLKNAIEELADGNFHE